MRIFSSDSFPPWRNKLNFVNLVHSSNGRAETSEFDGGEISKVDYVIILLQYSQCFESFLIKRGSWEDAWIVLLKIKNI